MPDYSNYMTRLAESKLQPFEYPDDYLNDTDLIENEPCNIGEGMIYYG